MEEERGNFRRAVFGGFDREDVINYIGVLAREAEEKDAEIDGLRGEITRLKDEKTQLLRDLEREREELVRKTEELERENRALESELRAQSVSHRRELEVQHERDRSAAEKGLLASQRVLDELAKSFASLKTDIGVNIQNAKAGLKNVETALSSALKITDDTQEKIAGIRESAEKED